MGGHAIEARLYAEDVPAGFLPATGTLHRFDIPAGPGVRVDAGYAAGSVVGPYYDAMLAKVIAHGRSRADAARRLARALAGARLHGVTTNRGLLLGILREPEFLAGRTDTGYLGRHDPAVLSAPADADMLARHAAAAALAAQAANRASAPVLASLPSGWRNVPSAPQQVSYAAGDEELAVAYRLPGASWHDAGVERVAGPGSGAGAEPGAGAGPGGTLVSVNGEPIGAGLAPGRIIVHRATPEVVDLEAAGVRRVYAVHRVAAAGGVTVYVDGPDGSSALTELPRFTDPRAAQHGGSLLAPMPGLVLRVLAEPGVTVTAGQPLVVLEAMKMEQTVASPAAGTVTELRAAPGQQVEAGQVLAVVTPDDQAPDDQAPDDQAES
jgi:acetyl/propionyl-CoA carboxylase alpha subunit